ncbi:TonB-dependent receptor [Acinetobacter sp. WZC-1]|uniref:TonB-dependent receptor n=1 Tax=Acinetobacter sp. WZC-1 TaxID=3459034 RepID=UPI00403D98C1
MKKINPTRSQAIHRVGNTIFKLSTLSLSMLYLNLAHAAEKAPAKVIKVTVTGSSIKGVAAQSASPITVVKVDDMIKQGVTTAEEAINKISANQSNFVTASNVSRSGTSGSTANLRGIGANKTLILLNGRRLAANAFDSGVTNLNIIPLAMLERIEVLRDGASAVYGTDAIGGVINFITKKQFTGLNISGGLSQPEESGGDKQDISVFGGFGDLDENGFNAFGVIDYRRSNDVMARNRKFSARGGLIPELGVKTGYNGSQPANFHDPTTDITGNPYAATGCNFPNIYPDENNCRFNSAALTGIVPSTEDVSAMGRMTLKLNDDFNAIGEYVYARNEVTTSVAPDVFNGDLTLNADSKYYPGNGITPAVGGISNGPLTLYLRSRAGNRVSESINESHRAFAGVEGEFAGWDINSGVTYAHSSATDHSVSGNLNQNATQIALNDGVLNPFGPQAAGDDPDLWKKLNISGDYQKASLDSTIFDITVSKPIFTLPAGDVGFALGGSFRHDDWKSRVNAELTSLSPSLGVDPDEPENKGKRDITSVFTELHVPLHKTLEAQLALRYDDYSDFGDTFNPKFSLRWEPIKQLMFRSSYSTGFRAPTLWEQNSPKSLTYTSSRYNDPVLCPGGVPAANGEAARDCGQQFYRQQGGNENLNPEESKSFTLGMVLEPIKNLVFSVDYFHIKVDDLIDSIAEQTIFGNPEKYADKFVRNANGSLSHIIKTEENLGGLRTQGFDIALNYLSPMTSTGRFGFGIDGTYITKYDFQNEPGGDWINNVGLYTDGRAVIRWKHTANINWSDDNWALNLQQQFTRGYKDQNSNSIAAAYRNHRVSDYTIYNISGTYKGFKNLELSMGIKNIFDEDPPASNVQDNSQQGYDPRYADPLGRTYFVRGTYKF